MHCVSVTLDAALKVACATDAEVKKSYGLDETPGLESYDGDSCSYDATRESYPGGGESSTPPPSTPPPGGAFSGVPGS